MAYCTNTCLVVGGRNKSKYDIFAFSVKVRRISEYISGHVCSTVLCVLQGCAGVSFLNLKTESGARLFKSMGISQPRTGFEHIWSICGGKLEPAQLKVHRECLILFHISFFLRCQGMAHVCSLSLLLAWKGISKLLWQMLALSPLCPAWHWNFAHAQTRTYRS